MLRFNVKFWGKYFKTRHPFLANSQVKDFLRYFMCHKFKLSTIDTPEGKALFPYLPSGKTLKAILEDIVNKVQILITQDFIVLHCDGWTPKFGPRLLGVIAAMREEDNITSKEIVLGFGKSDTNRMTAYDMKKIVEGFIAKYNIDKELLNSITADGAGDMKNEIILSKFLHFTYFRYIQKRKKQSIKLSMRNLKNPSNSLQLIWKMRSLIHQVHGPEK